MPPLNSALARPGIIKIVWSGGKRMPFGPCARCNRNKPLTARNLCSHCHQMTRDDGTRDEYGYPKDAKMADWAALRSGGMSIHEAAGKMTGIASLRTCYRYEIELARAGKAPWRATDPNIPPGHVGVP